MFSHVFACLNHFFIFSTHTTTSTTKFNNKIKEIKDTAIADGSDATSEVINVFNNLLNEELIQNKDLRTLLNSFECNEANLKDENTAKLYRRIYLYLYTSSIESRVDFSLPLITSFNFDR